MNRSALAHQPTGRSRLILASGVVALLLLIGAAGLRGVSQAEAIGRSLVEQTHAESLALGELRNSVLRLRSAEKDLLMAQPKGKPALATSTSWEQAVSAASAQARRLAGSADVERAAIASRVDSRLWAYADAARPALQQPETAGAYPVAAAAAAADKALEPARKLLDATETDLATLAERLGREATGSEEARRQASRQGYGLFAVTLMCSVMLAAALAVPGPPGAAAGQPADSPGAEAGGRRPPEHVPTLQPEVVTPDYSGIERRGPDRPQNIVRGEFNPKAASASRKTGPDGAGETS